MVGFRCSAPHTADELTALTRPKDQQLTRVWGGGVGGGGLGGGGGAATSASAFLLSHQRKDPKKVENPCASPFYFYLFYIVYLT